MPKSLINNKNNYLDVSKGKISFDDYGGYNSEKLTWFYQDKIYMIKSQEKTKTQTNLKYFQINLFYHTIIRFFLNMWVQILSTFYLLII